MGCGCMRFDVIRFLLAAGLFIALVPGVLVTIPAGSKGYLMSGQSSLTAVLVHAVVFGILLHFAMKAYKMVLYKMEARRMRRMSRDLVHQMELAKLSQIQQAQAEQSMMLAHLHHRIEDHQN